jgi:hypothetical protein
MNHNKSSENAETGFRRVHRGRRDKAAKEANRQHDPERRTLELFIRRSGGLTLLAAAVAIGLAACGDGSGSPHVVSLGTSTTLRTSSGSSGSSSTAVSTNNPTQLLDEWAACMRAHGDAGQADPTIDASKVIHLSWNNLPGGIYGTNKGGQGNAGPGQYCRTYIDTAESDLQGAQDPQQPSQVQQVQFSQCMRANGVPDFPDPSADGTLHFSVGGDLNPSNPVFQKASDLCAKKNGVPGLAGSGSPQPGSVVFNGDSQGGAGG